MRGGVCRRVGLSPAALRSMLAFLAFSFGWSLAEMRDMDVEDLLGFHDEARDLQKQGLGR